MADDTKYNGWKNYETWLVALWVGNEHDSAMQVEEMAQAAWDSSEADGTFSREERAKLDLSTSLKEWIEGMNPLSEAASVWEDLLGSALGEVDWYEWAENLLEDMEKGEAA